MYLLENKKFKSEIVPKTFAELEMTEAHMENILAANLDMIFSEESMIVIGKQVKNAANGRSDLTAIDQNGNMVLIEIKRDKADAVSRKESFESQAIRYAASYATIKTIEEVVQIVYAPYLMKLRPLDFNSEQSAFDYGIATLNEFLDKNHSRTSFNQKQRIILVSSDFDVQTLSASTWLKQNGIDISCFKMVPYELQGHHFVNMEKVLPLANDEDFLVNLYVKSSPTKVMTTGRTKRVLPKIKDMLEWKVVKEGEILIAKDRGAEAVLLRNGNVNFNNEEMTMQSWLREVYGWASVHTYVFAIHKESGKSLSEIREEYMQNSEEFQEMD